MAGWPCSLVLMLTATAALAGWYFTEGRFTTAPALTDLSRAEADQVATKSGLGIHFVDEYSETVPPGVVIATEPGAGTKIRRAAGSTRWFQGPGAVPMPKVVGLTQEAAENRDAEGQSASASQAQYSETVAWASCSLVRARRGQPQTGRPVDLTVSRGPKPIKITNYGGKPAATAKKALTKAGFKVEITTEHSDKIAKELVINQDPKSGTGMKGDTITLTGSLGPVMVTVPNVRRMGVKAAQRVMSDAGFKTKVQPVAVNYIGVGFVVYSNPRARSQAPKGSTITLYVV